MSSASYISYRKKQYQHDGICHAIVPCHLMIWISRLAMTNEQSRTSGAEVGPTWALDSPALHRIVTKLKHMWIVWLVLNAPQMIEALVQRSFSPSIHLGCVVATVSRTFDVVDQTRLWNMKNLCPEGSAGAGCCVVQLWSSRGLNVTLGLVITGCGILFNDCS